MQQTVASVFRRFAFAAFLGLWLLASGSVVAAAPAVPPTKKVQDIAAWDPYGLGGSTLSNVLLANNSFSGKLHVENIPDEILPDVIGFKSDGQRLYNLALIYPGKALVSLVPALRGTAVADAELPQLVVLLAPAANAGASIQLPVQVGTVKMPFDAGTTMRLDAGANILARANFGGQTAALLNMVGAPSRDLTLSGKIDPRMLSGAGLKNAPQNELINAIDLRVALRAPSLQRKPAYLVFGDSALVMKGISGKIASGIATSLSVNVGSGVRFDSVTINRDPVKRLVSIASSSINPGAKFLSLPVDGAAITDVVLNGLIDEQAPANDRYTLDGHYAVGGSTPREFTAALSGGTPAQYAVTVQTDTTLGQLMGWPVPGVDALVLKDVAFGNDYILGNLTLKGLKFTVALF
ncbi:MAG: hypothetical protein HY661_12855, partial [Betaproteobacteria bacterium]|nr:hypothetical protein [Betaproteobacteria bacterium]